MKLYKLTDEHSQTYGGTQWGEGMEHAAPGTGKLCSAGWIHAYTDLLVGVFLNPIHGKFQNPQAWEGDGDVGAEDHGLKVGCTRLRTLHRVELPVVTTEQRVRFAVLCAKHVYSEPTWVAWADAWLGGDRSAAAEAAWAAAEAAWGASWAASWAARAAAAAAWAARASWAAAWAAARGAAATVEASWAAAESAAEAAWAAAAAEPLDLPALARAALAEAGKGRAGGRIQ